MKYVLLICFFIATEINGMATKEVATQTNLNRTSRPITPIPPETDDDLAWDRYENELDHYAAHMFVYLSQEYVFGFKFEEDSKLMAGIMIFIQN